MSYCFVFVSPLLTSFLLVSFSDYRGILTRTISLPPTPQVEDLVGGMTEGSRYGMSFDVELPFCVLRTSPFFNPLLLSEAPELSFRLRFFFTIKIENFYQGRILKTLTNSKVNTRSFFYSKNELFFLKTDLVHPSFSIKSV